jgi:hypothetical protein
MYSGAEAEEARGSDRIGDRGLLPLPAGVEVIGQEQTVPAFGTLPSSR